MTTQRRLVRGAALSGASVFFSMFALLIVGKIATNYISQSRVAAFSLLLLFADGLNLLLTFGLPVSLPKLLGEASEEETTVITSSALGGVARCLLAASLVGLGSMFWIRSFHFSNGAWESTIPYLPLLAALFVTGAMRDTVMAALAGLHRYRARATGIVIASALQVGLSAILIVYLHCGVGTLIAINAASYGFAVIWFMRALPEVTSQSAGEPATSRIPRYILTVVISTLLFLILYEINLFRGPAQTLKTVILVLYVCCCLIASTWLLKPFSEKVELAFSWPVLWRLVRFSAPLYINSLLGFVFQRCDTILLAILLQDPKPVAVYEMAKKVPVVLSRGLAAMLVPFLPAMAGRLAAGDTTGASRLLSRATALTAVLGYGAVFGAIAVQELLIRFLFSKEYLGAANALGALMTATVIVVLTGLQGQTLIALGRPGQVTMVNLLTALVSVALNSVLIPRWGLAGAGAAAVGAAAFTGVSQAALAARAGARTGLRVALLPHVFAALAFGVLWYTHGSIAGRASALILFGVLCFAGRLVAPADLMLLRHVITRRGDEAPL